VGSIIEKVRQPAFQNPAGGWQITSLARRNLAKAAATSRSVQTFSVSAASRATGSPFISSTNVTVRVAVQRENALGPGNLTACYPQADRQHAIVNLKKIGPAEKSTS
jgi:hypothetical protein